MRYLRTNTAVRVTVGPFFGTDGLTPKTALTVTACKLTLMVDDGNVPTLVLDTNPAASGGANDMVHVTGDDAGFYDLELAAANVNYLGRALLALTDATNHCPVFHEFMILPAMIYDSLVLGTDRLDANVTHVGDTAQTAGDIFSRLPALVGGRVDASVGAMAAGVLTATAIAGDAITDAKVAADVTIASVTGAVGSVAGNVGGNVVGSVASVTGNVAGNVTGSVGSLATQAKADVNAEADAALADIGATSARMGYLDVLNGIVAAVATAVWGAATRVLTAGTNIVLAKGTGVTGFNDLSAAQVNAEADTALADYDAPTHAELTAELATADDAMLTAIATRASQTSVDDLPTNAELATALAAADDAVLAAVAALNNLSSAQVIAAAASALATYDGPTHAELVTALAAADDAVLAALAALNNLSSAQAQTAAAAALAAYDPPTHAELTAGLAAADDAVLTAIATLNNISTSQVATLIAAGDDATLAAIAGLVIPTAAQNADALIGRNIAGGSSSGRTVAQALAAIRNKTALVDDTLTVYGTDDSTPLWTAAVATGEREPVLSVDPS